MSDVDETHSAPSLLKERAFAVIVWAMIRPTPISSAGGRADQPTRPLRGKALAPGDAEQPIAQVGHARVVGLVGAMGGLSNPTSRRTRRRRGRP